MIVTKYIELNISLIYDRKSISISKVGNCIEIKHLDTIAHHDEYYSMSDHNERSIVVCLKRNCKLIKYSIDTHQKGYYLKLELEEI